MSAPATFENRPLATDSIAATMAALGQAARQAAAGLAEAPGAQKRAALEAAARRLEAAGPSVLAANARDVEAATEAKLSAALLDRLSLDEARFKAMVGGLKEVAKLPDPVGRVLAAWSRPNGLRIERVAVPIGVIAIIYEARPNVTADAGALCVMSGNAAILRGGSESFHSSRAIVEALRGGLVDAGLPADAIQLVPTVERAAVGILLGMEKEIDLVVPRGGRSLIERVRKESLIPVLAHLDGNCHVYVHGAADLDMAQRILFNSKMRRTGVCGAAETLLIDETLRPKLGLLLEPLFEAGCEIRGDEATQALDRRVVAAKPEDWDTEYLDAIIAVKVVGGLEEAIAHINRHGSHHTDTIVTADEGAATRFLSAVDSGIVLHNASTQFADGGEFGMGAEIGISTGKLHARGPVGVEQLTTYKYKVHGTGQIRP